MGRIRQFVCLLLLLALPLAAKASSYFGKVTFNGLAVPGATVTVTQKGQRFTTATDSGGVYQFTDLKDGEWDVEVSMPLFAAIHAQVTVGVKTPAGEWELTPLPTDQLTANARKESAAPETAGAEGAVALKKPEERENLEVPEEIPKGPPQQNDLSADGFLVNGSVNNAATSAYSTNPAFGNSRTNRRALYNGGLAAFVGNSATDARPYSVSGVKAPKSSYTHEITAFQIGGPLDIPHLMPRGPEGFVSYVWARNNSAAIRTGLVPTAAERGGDLSGFSLPLYSPVRGLPYTNNQVPVSPQAESLLNLYPMPDPGIPASSGYNFQAPVLNGLHEEALNSRLSKNFGREDQVYGKYNFASIRSDSVNLFGFVDHTAALGMNADINWLHRYTPHLFVTTTYQFSRLRTRVMPNFANRVNVSGAAGIEGNNQDATNWGPPALNFSSGFALLSDGNSEFNRDRTGTIKISAYLYHGRHNFTGGFEYTKEDYNELSQQNPRGAFAFTGAATSATGSVSGTSGWDLADFLIGVPDTSVIAFGNADKYFREPVYAAFFQDDWRMTPTFTINAGIRWQYGAPMTELHGRLVNLDIGNGFTAAAPVLASYPVGPITGQPYPASLMRPDWRDFAPTIGVAWRPIPASSVVVNGGYGIYYDSSVYYRIVSQMAQQAPLSKSLRVQNSTACSLTLADGFPFCSTTASDTFAVNPDFRIGYSQTWDLSVQRDLPWAMQITAAYLGIKGTHGPQEILPNTYPIGAANPCPDCPSGFVYESSGGNSTRQAGELQLRRRLMNGLAASVKYTYSKAIDDDSYLGGAGHAMESRFGQLPSAPPSGGGDIAQNWLDARAERSLSSFDQRQLVKIEAEYTSGEGLRGGTLMNGWKGRMLKEWTLTTTISAGTGLPETPVYPAAVPGSGIDDTIRPDWTGASITNASAGRHVNAAAYAEPAAGEWGTAGRNSITGPGDFTLDSSLARTFRPHGKLYLDLRVDATNLLNHPAFTNWNTVWGNAQFGLPVAANAMRSLQTVLRVRF